MRRRFKPFLWPPVRPSLDAIAAFLANLESDNDALVGPALPEALATLRQIVRAEPTPKGIAYHVYTLTKGRPGRVTMARRVPKGRHTPISSGFEALAPGEIRLLDGRARALAPPVLSPSPQLYVDVAARILTNGDERRALVIPTGADPAVHTPLPAGTYRLVFTLDRARWRSTTPDDTTNYRSTHTLAVDW